MALPSIARVSFAAGARRLLAAHVAIGIGLATVVAVGAIVASGATSITATPPSSPVPLTRAAFTPVVTTGVSLNEPLTVNFSTPMDEDRWPHRCACSRPRTSISRGTRGIGH